MKRSHLTSVWIGLGEVRLEPPALRGIAEAFTHGTALHDRQDSDGDLSRRNVGLRNRLGEQQARRYAIEGPQPYPI
jgi:hypothetical protein